MAEFYAKYQASVAVNTAIASHLGVIAIPIIPAIILVAPSVIITTLYPSEMKLPDLNSLEIIIYSVSHFIFYITPLILKKSQYLFSKLSSAFKKSVISNVFIHNFP